MNYNRRNFLRTMAGSAAGLAAFTSMAGVLGACTTSPSPFFKISLAQWSLNKYFRRWTPNGYTEFPGDPLDFPVVANREFGIKAIEYVNTFIYEKAEDRAFLAELKSRCDGEGVQSVLIMVDSEGNLGAPDDEARKIAVSNHYKWVEAAKFLGCHSIRVNARSQGTWDEQMKLASEGLLSLCEFADPLDINVIVENHGGLSSNGQWLSGVMKMVDHPRCGTLPDFGNFKVSDEEEYDRYRGVEELMPWAKGVSAKSYDFDEDGFETLIDYRRMLEIVKEAGYTGHIGIEYEGKELDQFDGIRATKALLEKLGAELSS